MGVVGWSCGWGPDCSSSWQSFKPAVSKHVLPVMIDSGRL